VFTCACTRWQKRSKPGRYSECLGMLGKALLKTSACLGGNEGSLAHAWIRRYALTNPPIE
jgi:hypothetical protein